LFGLGITIFGAEALFSHIFLTFIDLVFLFILTHTLLRQKICDTLCFGKNQKGSVAKTLAIFAAALVITLLTGFFGLYLLRIFSFFFIKLISKHSTHTDILVYSVFLVLIILNELFSNVLSIILRSLDITVLGYYVYSRDLMIIMATLSLMTISIMYYFKIGHRHFSRIDKNPIAKISIFSVSYIILTTFFLIRYVFQWEYTAFYITYVLFTGSLLIIVSMSFVKNLNQKYKKLAMQNHDLRKAMRGILNASRSGESVDLEKELADARYVVGIEEAVFDASALSVEENFIQLIEQKKKKYDRNIEIKTQIKYYEQHAHVGLTAITVMLELMLDNAIEETHSYPVTVKISVGEESLDVIVRNECTEKQYKDFLHYLDRGGSGKGGDGRGIGLQKLKGLADRFGGEIIPKHFFCHEQQTDYLSILVRIKG